jgi:3-hydroxyethyl bacteriochlorophyllide a dehydrogenase
MTHMPASSSELCTSAVVLARPERVELRHVTLRPPADIDLIVEVDHSGISTGTERLLWSGRMPMFPGMGYPLVPGYESIGRVVHSGQATGFAEGDLVFVPGSTGFVDVRGLFGGASRRVVVPAERVTRVEPAWGDQAVLLALAATAHHALGVQGAAELIVGHGVLGRLLARISVAHGGAPTVWETSAARRTDAACGCSVLHPDQDVRRDYRRIVDASGDASQLDALISRLAPGGEIVLGGFYDSPIAFDFARAFLREPRLRIAAQWQPADMDAVLAMLANGRLCLDGLVTHRMPAAQAEHAYQTAFTDAGCLKLVLDWRDSA